MGYLDVTGVGEALDELKRYSNKAEVVVPRMLHAGARILIDGEKREARRLFNGLRSTGQMAESIKATVPKTRKDKKRTSLLVIPQGYNNRNKPLAYIGYALEYGRPGSTHRGERRLGRKKRDGTRYVSHELKTGAKLMEQPWVATSEEKYEDEIHEVMEKIWIEQSPDF